MNDNFFCAKALALTSAFALFVSVASAQGERACDCGKEFKALQAYVEKNYPGFTDKTPTYGNRSYAKHTADMNSRAAKEKNETYCVMLLKEWLKYFKDDHLHIAKNEPPADDSLFVAQRARTREKIALTGTELSTIKRSAGVEGIYYRDDSVYKIAVVKRPNSWRTYAAVVIASKQEWWEPGMVKFEMKEKNDSSISHGRHIDYYPSIFYDNDHSIRSNKIMTFSGYGLDGGIWKKEGLPESEEEQNERNRMRQNRKDMPRQSWSPVELSQPEEGVALLKVASFSDRYTHIIDSAIDANAPLLHSTPALIIDLRNNGGGSDRSFERLLPYLYTGPIVTIGMAALATPDNIAASRRRAISVASEVRPMLDTEAAEMQRHLGHFTPLSNDTLRLDSVLSAPRKIVILINGNCASTTEQFLLAAQQSKKVTIMGTHTGGTLDYSNKRPWPLHCMPYTLEYPITRSGRLPLHPIDNIGIQPDIVLTDDTDWIKEAISVAKK